VFMDACHSGNVLGANQQRAVLLHQAINDLTGADNGAVVFTSSTGRQFSLENPAWNNGAFTKALVEGLNGAADIFNRQTITVNTLSSYVANRVRELTNGQQAPTTIIPGSVSDFPIAVVTEQPSVTANINNVAVVTEKVEKIETPSTKEIDEQPSVALPTTNLPIRRTANFYGAIAFGASAFGTYTNAENINGSALIFGADLAYFFIPNLGAGLKLNVANCRVGFMGEGAISYNDQVSFVGPALYSKFGKDRIAFIVGASAGLLNWKMSDMIENNISYNDESYSAIGGIISASISCMLTKHLGICLNVQTVLGTIKDQYDWERKPTGLGGTFGINFRF